MFGERTSWQPTLAAVILCLVAGTTSHGLLAGENGQDALDRAVQLKLSAETLSDLGEVISLCEKALAQGLDKESKQFAEALLSATRIERGLRVVKESFSGRRLDPQWPEYRRVALEDLERGVALDPQQPQAWLAIARLNLLPGGNVARALEALDQAVKYSGEEPALRIRALLLRSGLRNDAKQKLADLDQILKIDPKNIEALRLRGAVLADQEQYKKALADFDAVLAQEPDDAATLHARGMVLAELERYEEALEAFEKARRLAPGAASPLIEEARIRGLQSDFEKGIALLNEACKLQPTNPVVFVLRGSMYAELEQNDKALADANRALELRADFVPAMRLRAVLLLRTEKIDEAITQLEKLRQASADDLNVAMQLGILYSVTKQPRRAIEVLSEVLEKQTDEATAWAARANAYLSIGKHAEAIADFEKALELDPENINVLNNFAWVLATSPDDALRDGRRAIELATKACELTEYKADYILSTLAAGYAEVGDFDTAIKWSKKAVEVADPENKDQLAKELESYRQKKPWRERQETPEKENPPQEQQPSKPHEPAAKNAPKGQND